MTSLKLGVTIISLLSVPTFASNSNVYGSWFGSTGYGMTFLKLNRDFSFDWHYHSCTVADGYFSGNYKLTTDSIILKSEDEEIFLFLINGTLMNQPFENAHLVDSRTGLERTLRRTKFGASRKWKHEQNKRRRQRFQNKLNYSKAKNSLHLIVG